jgi:hypothetical protein
VASPAAAKSAFTVEEHKLKPADHETEIAPRVLNSGEALNEDLASEAPSKLYSYKDYEPNATIIYTWDVEEANEVADTLKGSVVGILLRVCVCWLTLA